MPRRLAYDRDFAFDSLLIIDDRHSGNPGRLSVFR